MSPALLYLRTDKEYFSSEATERLCHSFQIEHWQKCSVALLFPLKRLLGVKVKSLQSHSIQDAYIIVAFWLMQCSFQFICSPKDVSAAPTAGQR